jgi:hypothetical protein
MFLVLVLIEASDLMFAVDSIPAIFAVTTDPFIVFTSNIFAIMGLRALYFLLADMADRFHLLKYGLAIVLVFIGGKMTLMPWFHMPVEWSLAVVGGVILGSVVLSLIVTRKEDQTNPCRAAAGCDLWRCLLENKIKSLRQLLQGLRLLVGLDAGPHPGAYAFEFLRQGWTT